MTDAPRGAQQQPQRFRKRSEIVEVEQWYPGDIVRDQRLGVSCYLMTGGEISEMQCSVNTAHRGKVFVHPGDWLIRHYPFGIRNAVSPAEMAKDYEAIDGVGDAPPPPTPPPLAHPHAVKSSIEWLETAASNGWTDPAMAGYHARYLRVVLGVLPPPAPQTTGIPGMTGGLG